MGEEVENQGEETCVVDGEDMAAAARRGKREQVKRQASSHLKSDGTDRSQDLSKGVTYISNMIQTVLDKRLGMWEKYCLHHCFAVPEGFSLPQSNELPGESSMSKDALYDPDLDAQLDSLRDKLSAVGKESGQLSRELHALEKQSFSSDRFAGLASEALQLYEQHSVHDMFQEVEGAGGDDDWQRGGDGGDVGVLTATATVAAADMVKTATALRMRVDNMKARRMEDIERMRTDRINNPERDFCTMKHGKGLYNANLEDLQEFLSELKTT
ncbi:hypothetical protein EZV62_024080 [Acer yangbiense]|uniref:Uncharacterized protein n=1 Tax=Acer yangbiense TaxID=1000413 RepID=A0A5C7H5M1_9ROSI|nr:hypothetical protein EZV62_024080 [Acer yangbiense]